MNNFKRYALGMLILVGIFTIIGIFTFSLIDERNKLKYDKDSLSVEYKKMSSRYNDKARYADSVMAMNSMLYSQRQLTEAMNYRDQTTEDLLKVGDPARFKPDSSLVFVKNVIIGGGKYLYYVEYEVQFKDHHSEMVAPEMLIKL